MGDMTMQCHEARPLIPSYLDAELSEAQAKPLRKHLLDCQPCRASAQSEKNLKRWFVEPAAVAVPRDFAARVARRAFAGDRGERFSREPLDLQPGLSPAAHPLRIARRDDERNLRFVLALTALAAGLLFALALSIQGLRLPASGTLRADDLPYLSEPAALQRLDELNHKEGRVDRAVREAGSHTVAGHRP